MLKTTVETSNYPLWMHRLRSGQSYKATMSDEENLETGNGSGNEAGVAGLTQMLQLLLEDRRRRDEELLEKKRLREEEKHRERAEREEERRQQFDLLRGLVEGLQKQGEAAAVNAEKSKEREVRVAKLTDSDDIEAYLTTFERQMQVYEIEKERWAFKLAPQLSDRAQQVYASMDAKDSSNYDILKEAILKRYDITDESYRRRFHAARLKQNETNRELQVRQVDLVNKWMRACSTIEEIKDKLILEQLLETLPQAVKMFVKERKPATSQEAALLADDYVTAHKESKPNVSIKRESIVCHKCKKTGHHARECPGEAKTGVKAEEKEPVPKNDAKPKLRKEQLTCYHCHKRGHIAMECPDKACLCQQTKLQNGVLAKQLERPGKVGDHDVTKIVLDTGCTRTLVRRDWVSQDQFIEGAVVPIRCAHGDTVVYPLALVDITLGGCAVQVEAAVSETLPLDALLGTDVPVLKQLIDEATAETAEEDFLVTTRAQSKRRTEEERLQQEKEKKSGATPSNLNSDSSDKFEAWIQDLDNGLFEGGRVK